MTTTNLRAGNVFSSRPIVSPFASNLSHAAAPKTQSLPSVCMRPAMVERHGLPPALATRVTRWAPADYRARSPVALGVPVPSAAIRLGYAVTGRAL